MTRDALQSSANATLQCKARLSIVAAVATNRPKNDDQITFRIPSADKKDLKSAAERRDRSHNWMAREIVLKWLAKERRRRSR